MATLGAGRIFGELVSWLLLLDACRHCVLFWGFAIDILGGGFKYFLFSSLPGEMIHLM